MSKGLKITLIVAAVVIVGAAVAILLIVRSHTSDAHLSAIPVKAAAVLKVNIRDLAAKADPEKLATLPAFKDQKVKNDKVISAIVEDPFSTGIDPVENVYGFIAEEQSSVISALVLNVDDASKLGVFIKKLDIATDQREEQGIHIAEMDPMHCVAWNDEACLFLSGSNSGVASKAIAYLNQPKDRSIASSDAFDEFAGKDFDIGLYADNQLLSSMNGSAGSLAALGMNDGHSELLLSFADEQVTASFTNYPKTTATIPLLRSAGLRADKANSISPKDPLLFLGLSADLKAILGVAHNDPDMMQGLMGIQAMTGMTEAEISNVFTGDITVAISDYKDISEYDPRISDMLNKMYAGMQLSADDLALEKETAKLYTPLAYISVGITDKTRIEQLLAQSGMPDMNGVYYAPGMELVVYMAVSDDHVLITNDYQAAREMLANQKLDGKLPDGLDLKKPLTAWADLNQAHYPAAFTQPDPNGYYADRSIPTILQAVKPFESVELNGSMTGSELTLNLTKGEGNSLYRLIAYYASLN